MDDQEKSAAELENLEVTELEDGDLDEASGGVLNQDTINNQCTNTGC